MYRSKYLVLFSFFSLSCGSAAIDLKVQIASNQTENPILAVEQGSGSANTGIFFQFDELHCPPSSIDHVSGAPAIVYPKNPQSSGGFSATQGSYSVPASALRSKKYYRVTMVVFDISGSVPKYRGVADCPISTSDGNSQSGTICFGKVSISDPPICAGLTPISQCAALIQPKCQ